nr:MAG TPA: 14-3-3 protein gamma [Caudoviricetes sp.]
MPSCSARSANGRNKAVSELDTALYHLPVFDFPRSLQRGPLPVAVQAVK